MGTTRSNFYRDEPLFGLDIGNSSLKVMQISPTGAGTFQVLGYGLSKLYSSDCISEGAITDPKVLGEALYDVLRNRMVGSIDTRRVACSVPSSHTFSRPMKLPPMEESELAEAVRLEIEQYVPVPIDDLYIDWEVSQRTPKEIDISTVAIPKKIVDSYIAFLEAVELEPVALEPTMNSLVRLFASADPSRGVPSVLVDFGSLSTDLTVFDKTIFVNSTVPAGIDNLVNMISEKFSISPEQARDLKNSKGIAAHQSEILEILKPTTDNLVKEVQKIIRYHNERNATANRVISQVILSGGGSTMPGLIEYLSKALGMPARMMDPWLRLDLGGLTRPSEIDRSLFLTVAGVAMLNPKEILQ